MDEAIEMETRREDITDDVFDPGVADTSIGLPDVPISELRSTEQQQADLDMENFVDSVRKDLHLTKGIDPKVYNRLTKNDEGYFYYKQKRVSTRKGNRLLSVNSLDRNADTREFLRMIGYTGDEAPSTSMDRERQTVSPEQAESIKSKIESFKITEEWAKEKKEKAIQQLQQTTDESAKQTLNHLIEEYDQMEIQARRRYNEVTENQLKRINTIINDETRPLTERLRELFRRDGITIGALLTAIGMTISTIVVALLPTKTYPTPPGKPDKNTFTDRIKQGLVKIANWFLDLAKKALLSLPGALGGLISFLLKKAGEIVLFFSKHMIILLITLLVVIVEILYGNTIWRKIVKTN